MCGIWGITTGYEYKKAIFAEKQLKNRGPDYSGFYFDDNISLVHTRLSIIDLSEKSNQPFKSSKTIISFNGEIYNYKKIKKELINKHKYKFKTTGDTEVIVALYETLGIDGFKKLNGMFAFIIYDKLKNKTYFLRDPTGIKPLYYYKHKHGIIEASSLMSAMSIKKETNLDALNELLSLGYSRVSLYKNYEEFEPGIIYDENLKKTKIKFITTKKTFKKSIIEHFLTSDVPVGITLSGGIDSSYITYICSKIKKIHTFTIGFDKNEPDIIASRNLAKKLKTIHHEIILNKQKALKEYKKAIDILEIPMDMGSTLQTYLLGREIKKFGIKVILIGEGSDEINGGYRRHQEVLSKEFNKNPLKFYKNRIIKFNKKNRNEILNHNFKKDININLNKKLGLNAILDWDLNNEIRFYHLKRIDHIISNFGIEARVPYLDYSCIKSCMEMDYLKKVKLNRNKIILRNEAKKEGLFNEYVEMPKRPLKIFKDMRDIIEKNVRSFLYEKK